MTKVQKRYENFRNQEKKGIKNANLLLWGDENYIETSGTEEDFYGVDFIRNGVKYGYRELSYHPEYCPPGTITIRDYHQYNGETEKDKILNGKYKAEYMVVSIINKETGEVIEIKVYAISDIKKKIENGDYIIRGQWKGEPFLVINMKSGDYDE